MKNIDKSDKKGTDNDCYTLLAAGVKGKRYPIVCTKPYEHEGISIVKGEIGYQCWGRNIPDNWSRATAEDIKRWHER